MRRGRTSAARAPLPRPLPRGSFSRTSVTAVGTLQDVYSTALRDLTQLSISLDELRADEDGLQRSAQASRTVITGSRRPDLTAATIETSVEESTVAVSFEGGTPEDVASAAAAAGRAVKPLELLWSTSECSNPIKNRLYSPQHLRRSEEIKACMVCAECEARICKPEDIMRKQIPTQKDLVYAYELSLGDDEMFCYSCSAEGQARYDLVALQRVQGCSVGRQTDRGLPTKPTCQWFPGYALVPLCCSKCLRQLGWECSAVSPNVSSNATAKAGALHRAATRASTSASSTPACDAPSSDGAPHAGEDDFIERRWHASTFSALMLTRLRQKKFWLEKPDPVPAATLVPKLARGSQKLELGSSVASIRQGASRDGRASR